MTSFQLFRIKVEYSAQKNFLHPNSQPPAELIVAAIYSKPSTDPKLPTVWHIGNVEPLEDDGLCFRLGRKTTAVAERFDDESHDFVDEEVDHAPYTYVVVDTVLQVCAIGSKPKLAKTVPRIARRLEELLCVAEPVKSISARIVVAEIPDPQDFIKHLREADAILKFTSTFSLPNPFDADADLHKPLEQYLLASKGTKGKVEIKGEQLDEKVLESMVRSVASTGNTAFAVLRDTPKGKPVVRKLSHNPVVVQIATAMAAWKKKLLELLKKAYKKIRDKAGKSSK